MKKATLRQPGDHWLDALEGTGANFHGSPEAIAGALKYLEDEHISVEVIHDAMAD